MQEDMIDFPVADCWRDHYAAQGLTYPSGRKTSGGIPPTPRGGYSDADGDGWARVSELVDALNKANAEIERLRNAGNPPSSIPPKPSTFDE